MEEEDGIDDADLLDDGIVCRSLEFDIDTEEDDEDYTENDSVDDDACCLHQLNSKKLLTVKICFGIISMS